MKILKNIFFIIGFVFSITSFAQNIPELPKHWKGISTGTSVGVTIGHNPNNPSSPDKGKQGSEFNTFEVPGTLEVIQQKGRHLDLIFQSAYGKTQYIGTISADGKQIQLVSFHSSALFHLENNKIHGCGHSRGSNGTFEHWSGNHSAWCSEFTALTK